MGKSRDFNLPLLVLGISLTKWNFFLLHRSLSFKIERVINVDLAYYLIQNARTFSLALRVFLNLFLLDLLILAIVSK